MFYIRVYGTFLWHATVGRFFENIVHNVTLVCHVAEIMTDLNKQTMRRIKLTHGSAMVSEKITDETREALNKMTELAYKHQAKQCDIQGVINWHRIKQ